MTVEASFQVQADHLAAVAKDWIVSLPLRESLWTIIDNTQDELYEVTNERAASNLDTVFDSTETTIPTVHFRYWALTHQNYFFQTSRYGDAFSRQLTDYHWRISENLATVVTGSILLDPTFICADSGTNYGGYEWTGSDSTIAATDSALAMTSVGPLELIATNAGNPVSGSDWVFTVQAFFNDSTDSYVDSTEITVTIPNPSLTGDEVTIGADTLRAVVSADTSFIPVNNAAATDPLAGAVVSQYVRLQESTTEEIVQIVGVDTINEYLIINDNLRYPYTTAANISLLWSGIQTDLTSASSGQSVGYRVAFTNAQDRAYDYTTTYGP